MIIYKTPTKGIQTRINILILGERSRPRAARDTSLDYDESRRVTFTDEASDERQRSAAGAGSGLR